MRDCFHITDAEDSRPLNSRRLEGTYCLYLQCLRGRIKTFSSKTQCVPGVLFSAVKCLTCETDNQPNLVRTSKKLDALPPLPTHTFMTIRLRAETNLPSFYCTFNFLLWKQLQVSQFPSLTTVSKDIPSTDALALLQPFRRILISEP
jgi:hypothetical protein